MARMINNRGFTIIELLIVIVVIAIIASISVAVFDGIRQRAENTARISDARKMKSLIEQYAIINGRAALRSIAATDDCIGEGFIDVHPDPSIISCSVDSTGYYSHVNSTLNAALGQIGDYGLSSTTPLGPKEGSYTYQQSGPQIRFFASNSFVDGKPAFARMWYLLDGEDEDCVLRPLVQFVSRDNGVTHYTTSNDKINDGGYEDITYCAININVE